MTLVTTEQTPQLIDDLVRRIVTAVHPLQIILFGSAARGQLGPDSDLDVMVVMPSGTHRAKTVRYLYRQIAGFGFPVDIVVATPDILKQHQDNIGLIYRTVLAEGREVYVKPGSDATTAGNTSRARAVIIESEYNSAQD